MSSREYIVSQLDTLPEAALDKVQEFISFQLYSLGLLGDDTEYLHSIPGMVESIRVAATEPLADGIPASEVDFGV
jgi:hypothetical protein